MMGGLNANRSMHFIGQISDMDVGHLISLKNLISIVSHAASAITIKRAGNCGCLPYLNRLIVRLVTFFTSRA
jgi:hypothetical protein